MVCSVGIRQVAPAIGSEANADLTASVESRRYKPERLSDILRQMEHCRKQENAN